MNIATGLPDRSLETNMLSRKPWTIVFSLVVALSAASCGDDSDEAGGQAGADGGQAGPDAALSPEERCRAFCVAEEPALEGAYDVCSSASIAACVQDCALKIGSKTWDCAQCLMYYTDFDAPGYGKLKTCGVNESKCPGAKECTVSVYPELSPECSYCSDVETGEDDCIRTLFPRKEVDCSLPDWSGATSECKQLHRCP